MPIKYTYLEDSSPFTADALNTRISDATDGLNKLKQDDIGHGAFRTEHLPTVIGVPGIVDPADQLFAVSNHVEFTPTVYRSPLGSSFDIAGAVLNYTNTTGRPEIVVDGETSALLILFNLQVRRFIGANQSTYPATLNNSIAPGASIPIYFGLNYEDCISATFMVKVTLRNPNVGDDVTITIPHSARTISPGITQVEITGSTDGGTTGTRYLQGGRGYSYDSLSHKNVAIRTVLTGKYLFELLGYAPNALGEPVVGTYYKINQISVTGQCRFCKNGWDWIAIEYTKSNLTAIPIKAGVSTNE